MSPTEPAFLRALGQTHSLPERFGVDFLWRARGVWRGVQRKELKDLLASLHHGGQGDGARLTKEIGQMRGHIAMPMLVVEGKPQYTTDGVLMTDSWGRKNEWTHGSIFNLCMSIRDEGIQLVMVNTIKDTKEFIEQYRDWSVKDHGSIHVRGAAPGHDRWGRTTNRHYAMWFLQGFPDVGPVLASAILSHFGSIPLIMINPETGEPLTVEDLMQVKGLGRVSATRMLGVFHPTEL